MALSPQWGQSVVVQSKGNNTIVRAQPPPMTSAVGRPIIIRPRDPKVFTTTSQNNNNNNRNNNYYYSNGEQEIATGGSKSTFLSSLITGRDVAETFWIPDPIKNEIGLLEAMHRRTSANRTHVLLHSRPIPELQFNFSTCTGDNIDLSHDAFRLSKASLAILQLERNLSDGDEILIRSEVNSGNNNNNNNNDMSRRQATNQINSISGKVFKDQLKTGLRTIHEEEYYLVRYRDYSTWAVQKYNSISKKDHFWGKKYIEQCFAVHVGKEPGELIPITEAQFIFGVELLQRQLIEQVGLHAPSDINYCALSRDQFRSLGVLLGDGMREVGVEGEEKEKEENKRKREEEENKRKRAGNSDGYIPPSMWDWSLGAIKKRIDHQLQQQYQCIGRLIVRGAVLGVCVYIGWSYLHRTILPNNNNNNNRRRDRWGGRGNYNNNYNNNADGMDTSFAPSSFLRSVMLGPKEVFDYLLAPAH